MLQSAVGVVNQTRSRPSLRNRLLQRCDSQRVRQRAIQRSAHYLAGKGIEDHRQIVETLSKADLSRRIYVDKLAEQNETFVQEMDSLYIVNLTTPKKSRKKSKALERQQVVPSVLVQPEMTRRRFPLVSIPLYGGAEIFKASGSMRSDGGLGQRKKQSSRRPTASR